MENEFAVNEEKKEKAWLDERKKKLDAFALIEKWIEASIEYPEFSQDMTVGTIFKLDNQGGIGIVCGPRYIEAMEKIEKIASAPKWKRLWWRVARTLGLIRMRVEWRKYYKAYKEYGGIHDALRGKHG